MTDEKQKQSDFDADPKRPDSASRSQNPQRAAEEERKRQLDSIHIEIEPARAQGPEKPEGKSPEESKPKAPTPPESPGKKKPSGFQPAIYELDVSQAEEVLDSAGHIDWSRAMSTRHLAEKAEKSDRPTSEEQPKSESASNEEPSLAEAVADEAAEPAGPARPETPVEVVEQWTHLPGAEKVLRVDSAAKRPRNPSIVRPSKSPTPAAPGKEEDEEPMSRYEKLKRQSSFRMDPEAVKTANEFSDILFHVNRALILLGSFREKYPYLIAPNVFAVWEDNLKESAQTMLREFQHMKDPRSKQYDRKYVCKVCKSVFFVSLPDGICDECRGKISSQAPY
jgi:hypothetical protein